MKVTIDGKEIELDPQAYKLGYKNGNIDAIKHAVKQIEIVHDSLVKLITYMENINV